MLRISDFARIGQVSMSALRYYDEIGLLSPIHVDEETGYRFQSRSSNPASRTRRCLPFQTGHSPLLVLLAVPNGGLSRA